MGLLLLLPLAAVFLLLGCIKDQKAKVKKDCQSANNLRRDLAVADSDAPSIQGSAYADQNGNSSVYNSAVKDVSMSGQVPKTRQVPMSESIRAEFNESKMAAASSKMDSSVQMSQQQSSKMQESSVQQADDADYFQKKSDETEKSYLTVDSN